MLDDINKIVLNVLNYLCPNLNNIEAVKASVIWIKFQTVRAVIIETLAAFCFSRARYAIVDADDSGEYQITVRRECNELLSLMALKLRPYKNQFSDCAIVDSIKALLKVNWHCVGCGLKVIQGRQPIHLWLAIP